MKIWVYSVYDPENGELLHKGTAKELTEVGVICHSTRMSNIWAKYQRQLASGMPFQWRIEREKQEVKLVRKPRDKTPSVSASADSAPLSVAGATSSPGAGEVFLKEGALRPHPSAGADTFSRPGEGFLREGGFDKGKAAKGTTGRFERLIKNPTPLQQDVHELCLYNETAKKAGRPQLSYGEWASKGKPDAESLWG